MEAIKRARKLEPATPANGAIASPEMWLQESLLLAKSTAYALPVGAGIGPYELTSSYKSAAGEVAEKQIALAGTRLATVLGVALR
jgi:hypothetical protein